MALSMKEYIEYFYIFPDKINILLIAALPIVELRGAIPIAILEFNINPFMAFLLAVIGNLIPVVFILTLFDKVAEYLSNKSKICKKFFTYLYQKTHRKHKDKFSMLGSLALITFVAIPLPFTGAWTGALAAIVFQIPIKKALLNIFIGVLIAGVIITLSTLGLASIF